MCLRGCEILILKITMESISNNKIILPIHYNHIVQGFIYGCLNKDLSRFLHEEGYKHRDRTFKMFTFSRLDGTFSIDKKNKQIVFCSPISLVISSPVEGFFNSLASTFLIGNSVRLGNNSLKIISIEGDCVDIDGDEVTVQTLSPIVLYSTFLRPDKRKYTCYFQPGDPDYDRLITENLKKKYISYFNSEPPKGDIRIINFSHCRKVIIKYKDIIIKGYDAKLKISGPKELLKIGLESGIGSKNSQGFGLVKLLN